MPLRVPVRRSARKGGKGRSLLNYRKAYGKLRGGILPELGGNFRLCAVDQKRSFFPKVGPFLDLLPFKGPFPLTGALRADHGKAPYGEASYRKAPSGRLLTGGTCNYRKAYGKAGPLREAPYEEGRSLREGPVPYGKGGGPLRVLHKEGPLTGRLLTGRFQYRKAYGKGRGPLRVFHREGRRRGLREGPVREAPYEEGRCLREGPVPYGKGRGPLRVLHSGPYRKGPLITGCPFTEKDDEEAYGKAGPYGPLRDGWALTGRPLTRREGPLRGPLRERLYGKRRSERPLTRQESLTGTLTGRRLHGQVFYGLTGDPYGVLCKLNYQGTQNPKS